MILVAPTEPLACRAIGKVSSLPEQRGCDFLLFGGNGSTCGIQRKEVKDLRASVEDGRLAKELDQMDVAQIEPRLLIVEGTLRWTGDGKILDGYGSTWNRARWLGVLWSAQSRGLWLTMTRDIAETCETVRAFESWSSKASHSSLTQRPGPGPGIWGKTTSRQHQEWILQGFPGIGPELSRTLVEHFGSLPMGWTVTPEELLKVEGLGKKKVEQLMGVMGCTH